MNDLFQEIYDAILDGAVKDVEALTKQALEEGYSAKEILNDALLEGMNEVGVQFKEGDMFVPEVLVSAKALDAGVQVLKPLLQSGDVEKKGKIVFATVKGDLHDIGKKLCILMLEGAGFEVIDIGIDVAPEKIAEAVVEHQPNIVALSAMLTTTMTSMKETIEYLKEKDLYSKVKVMVGGAPVSEQYATSIGAIYSADATDAVEVAKTLVV